MVKKKLKRIIIAAVSSNRIIGRGNRIPWKNNKELKHFKETTLGHPVIMGRKTYDSLKRKLPGRLNIIISNSAENKNNEKDLLYFDSLESAYNYLRGHKFDKVFICGGGRIYRSAVKHAEAMIISHMDFDAEGDVFFPKFNPDLWRVRRKKVYEDFTVKFYLRKNP